MTRRFLTGLLLLALAATVAPAAAQGTVRRHLVYFRDKAGTPFSVAQPQAFLSARAIARRTRQGIAVLPRDLPVTPAYVAQVRAVAGQPRVLYTSRWFNAALVSCDSATLGRIAALPRGIGIMCVRAGRQGQRARRSMHGSPRWWGRRRMRWRSSIGGTGCGGGC